VSMKVSTVVKMVPAALDEIDTVPILSNPPLLT